MGYSSKFPDIRIHIRSAGTLDVVGLVLEDEAHMGLAFQPEPEAKIRVRASSDQPLKIYVSPEHPLSRLDSVTFQDIDKERIALPEAQFRICQVISSAAATQQVFLKPALVSNSLRILKEFARTGSGITILPGIAAHTEVAAGTLSAVSIDHPAMLHTSASVITRLGRQLPVSAVRLLQKIEATMPFFPAI